MRLCITPPTFLRLMFLITTSTPIGHGTKVACPGGYTAVKEPMGLMVYLNVATSGAMVTDAAFFIMMLIDGRLAMQI